MVYFFICPYLFDEKFFDGLNKFYMLIFPYRAKKISCILLMKYWKWQTIYDIPIIGMYLKKEKSNLLDIIIKAFLLFYIPALTFI